MNNLELAKGIAAINADRDRLAAEVARLQQLLDPAALEARIAERERALVEQVAALREAAAKSYSLLSMLPAREFWNPADAADSFDGRYGKLMREKFDAAWEALEAEGFGKLDPTQ